MSSAVKYYGCHHQYRHGYGLRMPTARARSTGMRQSARLTNRQALGWRSSFSLRASWYSRHFSAHQRSLVSFFLRVHLLQDCVMVDIYLNVVFFCCRGFAYYWGRFDLLICARFFFCVRSLTLVFLHFCSIHLHQVSSPRLGFLHLSSHRLQRTQRFPPRRCLGGRCSCSAELYERFQIDNRRRNAHSLHISSMSPDSPLAVGGISLS